MHVRKRRAPATALCRWRQTLTAWSAPARGWSAPAGRALARFAGPHVTWARTRLTPTLWSAARELYRRSKRTASSAKEYLRVVAIPAVRLFARRHARSAWRRLGFVPSFGVGVGLLTGLAATLLGSRHALAFGFTCGVWAFVLALGVGLVIHARSAFHRALDVE